MKISKSLLLATALISLALLAAALYLQHIENMQPCPLCILQRYAFVAVALICLISLGLPKSAHKAGVSLSLLSALAGAGTAGWHLWVIAHPGTSCGIDPLETSLNAIPTATLLPFLFKANGFCTAPYEPILGLSIPLWSLSWFVILSIILSIVLFKRHDAHTANH